MKKHIHHHTRTAWCFVKKRKTLSFLVSVLTAMLLAVAGVAGCDLYARAKAYAKLHHENAVAVPFLAREVSDLRAQVNDMQRYTNADCWRWRRQEWINTNLDARVVRLQNNR